MGRPSKKRREKKDKRKTVRRLHSEELQRQQYLRRSFPDMTIVVPSRVNERFADAVRTAVDEVVLDHQRVFGKELAKQLQSARRSGSWSPVSAAGEAGAAIRFQKAVLAKLPAAIKASYFPTHSFNVRPAPQGRFRVTCQGLISVKTRGGSAYRSPRQPTVAIGGHDFKVAFLRHAIDRVLDRAVFDPSSYMGYSDAFAILHDCTYFEPCELSDGQPGLVVYDRCVPGFFSYQYVLAMIEDPDAGEDYYYRLGYCPLVLEGDMAIAKTMLIPGMKSTPEWDRVLRRQRRTVEQQKLLRDRVEKMTRRELAKSQDFELFKQFHLAGIRQVVTFAGRKVFVYD